MKIITPVLFAAALVAAALSTARAEVPTVIPFAGRLADDSGPIEGMHTFTFRLYDTQEDGTGNQLWSERHMDVAVEEGLVYARLGSLPGTPLGASIFDGRRLYLEIVVDNTTIFSPRLALESVPYAVRAGTADMLGGYEPDDLQQALTGDCNGGVVVGVGANGVLHCEADDNSGGTVQSVTAGTGLTGGGSGAAVSLAVDPTRVQSRVSGTCAAGQYLRAIAADGSVTCAADADTDTNTTYTAVAGGGVSISGTQIGLLSCSSNQVLKVVGGAWSCAADTDTNTTYTAVAGGGVNVSGTQIGLATCATGQVLKMVGGAWSCAADIDTDTDTNTTYTAVAGGGVNVSGTQIGLASCASGQVLKAGATAGAWTCAADASNAGTITSVVAGSGLSGGGSSGAATLSVDSAYVQRRVSGACAVGESIRSIAADGTVTCEPKAPRTFYGTVDIARTSYSGAPSNWTPFNYFTFDLSQGIATKYDFRKPGQAMEARLCILYTDSGDSAAVNPPVHVRLRRNAGTEVYVTGDFITTFSGSNLPVTRCTPWSSISNYENCGSGFNVSCAIEVKHDQARSTLIERVYIDVAGVN